jgi:hypothetical protein
MVVWSPKQSNTLHLYCSYLDVWAVPTRSDQLAGNQLYPSAPPRTTGQLPPRPVPPSPSRRPNRLEQLANDHPPTPPARPAVFNSWLLSGPTPPINWMAASAPAGDQVDKMWLIGRSAALVGLSVSQIFLGRPHQRKGQQGAINRSEPRP